MATVTKDFRVKAGLVVEGSTATVNNHDILTEALVDAKGDLLVASAADTVTRLAVGTNGHILTANSSATNGIEWAAAPAVGVFDTQISFEGATADDYETTLTVTNPTADRTITLPDVTGTVVTTGDTGSVTNTMLAGSIANDKLSNSAITINGTSTSLGGSRTLGSDDIAEGSTNKYFTDERAQDAIGTVVGTGLDYDDSTGVISVDPSEFALSAVGAPTGNVSMATYKITGLGDPTSAQDAATKAYVDSAAQGIDWKASVRAATTANVTLASNLENGDVLDGVTLATGDRVLVKDQSTGSENGIYVVKVSGAPDRSTDADAGAELTANFAVFVEEGTLNADQGYTLTNNGAITVGTTALTFTQFTGLGQIVAGTGLDKTGNTLDIDSTVVTLTGTQTLTNKTLTSPTISGLTLSDGSIVLEGATANDHETTITVTDPTADRTITLPDATGTVALTNNKLDVFAATTSTELASVISDETGSGALVFGTSPTLTTPNIGAATATSLTLTDALIGTATQALTDGTATVVDSWSATTYSSAKYLVQMKKGTEIQTIEILVNVDGSNNVALTEYADVINAAASLGTTNADYSGGNVRLLVTASNETTVKVHKTLIEA